MSLKSGHTIVQPEGRLKELCDLFELRGSAVLLTPGNWTVFGAIDKYGDKYYDFNFYEDDVIINTVPKAGTTWMQEVVWTLRHNINLDNPDAKIPLATRSLMLDADYCSDHLGQPKTLVNFIKTNYPDYDISEGPFIKACEVKDRPRLFKLHLGLPLLNPNILQTAKVVYVIRDPRDVCLSYYYHCRAFTNEGFVGNLEEFVETFLCGGTSWGPYWVHVKSGWDRRDHPNMCIMFYDKMKRNPKPEYRKLATFLGSNPTDEQLDKIIHFTSFDEMKKRDDHVLPPEDTGDYVKAEFFAEQGGFFRKGSSGGWKEELTDEMKKKFDAWERKYCPDPEILKQIRGE